MEGLHLTADCFACQCDRRLLIEEKRLSELVRHITLKAGLNIVGEKMHAFSHPDGSAAGVTGTLLLAESHVAFHTWPERQAVTLDVYVCNFENDNSDKARMIVHQLVDAFQAQQVSRQELIRGIAPNHETVRVIEHLSPYTAMHTQLDHVLADVQSAFQQIQIADTPEFGKVMRIDGAMMTSEKDEFYYHECLVHPAALTHGAPKTALIIGGGDGGSTEELLKYTSIQEIILCEIDPKVIALAREHLGKIHQDAFNSPKVRVIHADGFAFIQEQQTTVDLILLDLTDPVAPNGSHLAESCMSDTFFRACFERLNPHGQLVLHLGSTFYHSQRYQATLNRLTKIFDLVRPYAVFIPLYGALWGMAVASKSDALGVVHDPLMLDEKTILARLDAHHIHNLQFYNARSHQGIFAIAPHLINAETTAVQQR